MEALKVPVSVCIPTKDRPEELRRCIESILAQSRLPEEIVVIDDGSLEPEGLKRMVGPVIVLKYYRKDKPGTSASRNLARNFASCDLILFLDDDVVLERDFIKHIYELVSGDQGHQFGIFSGVVANRKGKSFAERLFKKIFLLDDGNPGRLLPWGFQTGLDDIKGETEVEWASVGTSCFRREVFEGFSFEEHQGGRNALEDVEFGYKIRGRHGIVVTPKARLHHFHAKAGRESRSRAGFKQAYNRCWIFSRHCEKTVKNRFAFAWAMAGHILGMTATGRFRIAYGNIKGIVSYLKNRGGRK